MKYWIVIPGLCIPCLNSPSAQGTGSTVVVEFATAPVITRGIDIGYVDMLTDHAGCFVDMNNDGAADFVTFRGPEQAKYMMIYESNRDGTFATQPFRTTTAFEEFGVDGMPRRLVDFNGDGYPDFVCFSRTNGMPGDWYNIVLSRFDQSAGDYMWKRPDPQSLWQDARCFQEFPLKYVAPGFPIGLQGTPTGLMFVQTLPEPDNMAKITSRYFAYKGGKFIQVAGGPTTNALDLGYEHFRPLGGYRSLFGRAWDESTDMAYFALRGDPANTEVWLTHLTAVTLNPSMPPAYGLNGLSIQNNAILMKSAAGVSLGLPNMPSGIMNYTSGRLSWDGLVLMTFIGDPGAPSIRGYSLPDLELVLTSGPIDPGYAHRMRGFADVNGDGLLDYITFRGPEYEKELHVYLAKWVGQ